VCLPPRAPVILRVVARASTGVTDRGVATRDDGAATNKAPLRPATQQWQGGMQR
jgi:hypothetical protein